MKRHALSRFWSDHWPGLQLWVLAVALAFLSVGYLARVTHVRALRQASTLVQRALAGAVTERDEALAALVEARERLAELDRTSVSADVALYQQFMELLPSSGRTMQFMRDHPFDQAFQLNDQYALQEFLHEWDIAERTFHDDEIESARQAFHHAAQAFREHVARVTFRRKDESGLYQVYPDADTDFETDENGYVFAAIEKANDLAAEVWATHQRFVDTARRRLRI